MFLIGTQGGVKSQGLNSLPRTHDHDHAHDLARLRRQHFQHDPRLHQGEELDRGPGQLQEADQQRPRRRHDSLPRRALQLEDGQQSRGRQFFRSGAQEEARLPTC